MAIVKAPFKNFTSPSSSKLKRRIDMSSVGTLILGGGTGTRLFPLTLTRCKPAISFGGRYRLIDIPMSNALNSGCKKIYILTQFLSASLHQHVIKTYRLEHHTQGFVEILSAEQKPAKNAWYQGTADAIRQNIEYLAENDVDYFLVLSGDQLYQMDFSDMVAFAEEKDADLVVASLPVDESSAKRMGIMKLDQSRKIIDFTEKPQHKQTLENFKASPSFLESVLANATSPRQYVGSMGIYLFKRQALFDLLQDDLREDFGKHLIPFQAKKGKTFSYVFDGYWEDIGTIESFYTANIQLTQPNSHFNLHDSNYPIHTAYQSLPPPKIVDTNIYHSLICEGSTIAADAIRQSIVGPRTQIGKGTIIETSYLFGNDYYYATDRINGSTRSFTIGENCYIKKAIVDKQAKIGNNVKLINKDNHLNYDGESFFVRDGIIIVTRGACLPDGFEF